MPSTVRKWPTTFSDLTRRKRERTCATLFGHEGGDLQNTTTDDTADSRSNIYRTLCNTSSTAASAPDVDFAIAEAEH
jgi:hypothetical protein